MIYRPCLRIAILETEPFEPDHWVLFVAPRISDDIEGSTSTTYQIEGSRVYPKSMDITTFPKFKTAISIKSELDEDDLRIIVECVRAEDRRSSSNSRKWVLGVLERLSLFGVVEWQMIGFLRQTIDESVIQG